MSANPEQKKYECVPTQFMEHDMQDMSFIILFSRVCTLKVEMKQQLKGGVGVGVPTVVSE